KTNPDIDKLSIHLSFYLASWGMYRGSSFLLQKDYKIHEEAVKEIIKEEYDSLVAIKFNELKGENLEKMEKLNSFLRQHYRKTAEKDEDEKISDILITKILLGTLGCVPAYDQYFSKGFRKFNVLGSFSNKEGKLNEKSIMRLAEFYEKYEKELEDKRKDFKIKINNKNVENKYPQMKVLDMGFWQIGTNNKKSNHVK
ncbi:MAG: hypothetical protein J6U90_04435, partial [Methanobrevibacter sp.]|nr:hypothetical protein [Methanobrevibacter sp.]